MTGNHPNMASDPSGLITEDEWNNSALFNSVRDSGRGHLQKLRGMYFTEQALGNHENADSILDAARVHASLHSGGLHSDHDKFLKYNNDLRKSRHSGSLANSVYEAWETPIDVYQIMRGKGERELNMLVETSPGSGIYEKPRILDPRLAVDRAQMESEVVQIYITAASLAVPALRTTSITSGTSTVLASRLGLIEGRLGLGEFSVLRQQAVATDLAIAELYAPLTGSAYNAENFTEVLSQWSRKNGFAHPELPSYNGTTSGVLYPTTPSGLPVPLHSTPRQGSRFPYSQADGHVETNAARYMSENGIVEGTVYHNNPKGTCGNCDRYTPTYLDEGSVLRVIPPSNAVAPKPSWKATPTIYKGNSNRPN
jgi:hypothetical protein